MTLDDLRLVAGPCYEDKDHPWELCTFELGDNSCGYSSKEGAAIKWTVRPSRRPTDTTDIVPSTALPPSPCQPTPCPLLTQRPTPAWICWDGQLGGRVGGD